ncbi:MAG: protein-L-isoaspartate(D-aspartate) O-methyltransferase [Spirochaetaceae bacterium]|nr:MAG: protein-L-isoaspartate(D-aspartate) O-methyltransferase [Spirochaetaceae bacterium]
MPDNSDLVREAVRKGLRSRSVVDAMKSVDRRLFVGSDARSQELAYKDAPVPIAERQTTSQPSLIASMLEALAIQPHERALEIGTGYGYQTALLSILCREVVSVERFAELAERAAANLERCGMRNVIVIQGDGGLGVPEHAPYDVVIGSAAAPAVPPPFVAQLSEGGRVVIPIGPGGHERVLLYRKTGGELIEERVLTQARYVRMIGEHAHPE